jgi:hypothetical protein
VIGDALDPANAGTGRRPGELGIVDETARHDARPRPMTSSDVRSVIGGRPETAVAIPARTGRGACS